MSIQNGINKLMGFEIGFLCDLDSNLPILTLFFGPNRTPGRGCPRCLHEFSCSRTRSDLAAQGRQASGAVPKERRTSAAQVHCRPLRGAQGCQPPDTACSRLTQFGRRPQEVATPQFENFSSHPTKWATRTPQGVPRLSLIHI